MLPGMMIPLGAAAQSAPPTIAFLQQADDSANRSTYTFSSQSLGAAAANRYIAVAVGSYILNLVGSPIVSSVTVAGVTATKVVSVQDLTGGGAYGYSSSIYIAAVPTGTTGNIVCSFPSTQYACSYAAWRLTNISTATAFGTASDNSGSGSVNVNVSNTGVVVASAIVYSDTSNSWAGVTERYDDNIESSRTFTGGDHTATATEYPRTVTITSSSVAEAVVAASWV